MNPKIANQEAWKRRIEEWQASGKSGPRWSKEQNISYSTFLYWKTKFSKKNKNFTSISFVELIDLPSKSSTIELIVANITIRVPSGFDPSTLKSCLKLLMEVSC